MTYYMRHNTPAGEMLLTSDGEVITGLYWTAFRRAPTVGLHWIESTAMFSGVVKQLDEYFAGKRRTFDMPIALHGTPFQESVWRELQKIPFGKYTSYQAIATTIGKPKAVRAVGTAVGSNPLSIIVPCHRVLASDRKLGGYAGGLDGKRTLLAAERIAWKEA